MARIITKGQIGVQDFSQGAGTFARATSTGGTQTLNQVPIFVGTGSPAGVLAAAVGSLYLRTDGGTSTTLYVKETGAATTSGWVAK
jgi:hypothetical protein